MRPHAREKPALAQFRFLEAMRQSVGQTESPFAYVERCCAFAGAPQLGQPSLRQSLQSDRSGGRVVWARKPCALCGQTLLVLSVFQVAILVSLHNSLLRIIDAEVKRLHESVCLVRCAVHEAHTAHFSSVYQLTLRGLWSYID
jgi:hypothetical protein